MVGGGEQRPGGPTTLMGPPNQPTSPTPSLSDAEASNTNGASADNYQPPHRATTSIKNPEILRQFSELCVAAKSSKL